MPTPPYTFLVDQLQQNPDCGLIKGVLAVIGTDSQSHRPTCVIKAVEACGSLYQPH